MMNLQSQSKEPRSFVGRQRSDKKVQTNWISFCEGLKSRRQKIPNMNRNFIYTLVVCLGALLAACTDETKDPPPKEPQEVPPREQLQMLRLRAGASPQMLQPGQTSEIDVLVTDTRGVPVSGANVEIAAGGGIFTATGQSLIVGPTDGTGQFRAEWQAPALATSGYKLSFLARVEGQAEGREELLILME